MNVKNLEKKENSSAIFQVEVDGADWENALNAAYRRIKGQVMIPGFRKGKAPRVVIEGMYGKEVFYEDALEAAAPEAFAKGIEKLELEAVGYPSIADYKVENDVLTVTFVTDIYPEITLGEYKGIEGEYSEPTVSDEQVERSLEQTRKQAARYVDVERPVQTGDTVVFDFEGFCDGEAFEGGKAENYTLEVGSGSFIPGFEEGLVGMEKETDGEIKVVFPEQYDEKLAGKPAVFKVKIHTVREAQLPELDDEFAKDVSEFDTLEEYKADLRKNLTEEAGEEAERSFKSDVMHKACDNMTVAVPKSMVDEKMDEFLRSYADNMGIPRDASREEVIQMLGLDDNSFNMIMRPAAEAQVKSDLLLDAIAKAEGLGATDEDKQKFYDQLREDYGESAERIKGMIDEKLMLRDIERRKASELLYGSAIKVAPQPKEEAPEETEEAPAEAETED